MFCQCMFYKVPINKNVLCFPCIYFALFREDSQWSIKYINVYSSFLATPTNDQNGFKREWNSTYICPIHRQRFVKILRICAGNRSLVQFKSHWKGLRKFQPPWISYLCQILLLAIFMQAHNIPSSAGGAIFPYEVERPLSGVNALKVNVQQTTVWTAASYSWLPVTQLLYCKLHNAVCVLILHCTVYTTQSILIYSPLCTVNVQQTMVQGAGYV